MAREIKIGIFTIVAIAILVVGYNYLKGKDLLSRTNTYYVEYTNVDQLQNSAPVLVNGLRVGMVQDVYLKPDDYSRIIVVLEVDNSIRIPKDAVAEILSTGLMGGKAVRLVFESLCEGDNCAQTGDYLKGVTKGLLDSMVGTDKVDEYLDVISKGVNDMVDSLSRGMEEGNSEVAKTFQDLQETIANLRSTTGRLDGLLARSGDQIVGTMDNLEKLTAGLRSRTEEIQRIIANADTLSGNLADLDLKGTSEQAGEAIANLKKTLASADEALSGVKSITDKINNGEGTLGMLIQDEALYRNLNKTTRDMDLLLQDVRLNPKRYTRFLSKKQIPYELPEEDPARE